MMTASECGPILVVEDGDEDFEMLQLALGHHGVGNPLLRCSTGEEALALLDTPARPVGGWPVFVLLDLSLPGSDGGDLLVDMRSRDRWARIPVVVLSTSDSPRDVSRCYAAGANAYAIKPLGLERFEVVVGKIAAFWLDCAALPSA